MAVRRTRKRPRKPRKPRKVWASRARGGTMDTGKEGSRRALMGTESRRSRFVKMGTVRVNGRGDSERLGKRIVEEMIIEEIKMKRIHR